MGIGTSILYFGSIFKATAIGYYLYLQTVEQVVITSTSFTRIRRLFFAAFILSPLGPPHPSFVPSIYTKHQKRAVHKIDFLLNILNFRKK